MSKNDKRRFKQYLNNDPNRSQKVLNKSPEGHQQVHKRSTKGFQKVTTRPLKGHQNVTTWSPTGTQRSPKVPLTFPKRFQKVPKQVFELTAWSSSKFVFSMANCHTPGQIATSPAKLPHARRPNCHKHAAKLPPPRANCHTRPNCHLPNQIATRTPPKLPQARR